MTSAHRILLVEDEPAARELAEEALRSEGYDPRAVATVNAALAAIEEEEFCAFVLDQELPLHEKSVKAFASGGERLVAAARDRDRRRTPDGTTWVTPILALTGYSSRPQFVSGLFERGIDAFVEKSLSDNVDLFHRTMRSMMARAGRATHAGCASLRQRNVTTPRADAPRVRLSIDGKATRTGRSGIVVCGETRELQDGRFVALLRFIDARDQSPEGWSSREAAGIAASRNATTYIREAFAGLVPEGFEVLEGDRRGNVRLNLDVVIESVDWDALARHPDPAVLRLVDERRKRRGKR